MIFCIACGTTNPPEAKFCCRCGQPSVLPPPLAPPPLPDEKNLRRLNRGVSLGLIVLNLVLLGLLEIGLIFVRPVFAAMFADFGAKLPAPTEFFFSYGGVVGLAALGGGILVSILIKNDGDHALVYLVVAALVQFLLLSVVGMSFFLPIFQLGAVAGGLQK